MNPDDLTNKKNLKQFMMHWRWELSKEKDAYEDLKHTGDLADLNKLSESTGLEFSTRGTKNSKKSDEYTKVQYTKEPLNLVGIKVESNQVKISEDEWKKFVEEKTKSEEGVSEEATEKKVGKPVDPEHILNLKKW